MLPNCKAAFAFIGMVFLLGGRPGIAQDVQADLSTFSNAELDSLYEEVMTELALESVRVRDYLAYHDQILRMRVVAATLSLEAADADLRELARRVFDEGFDDAEWDRLIETHRAAFRDYVLAIEGELETDAGAREQLRQLLRNYLDLIERRGNPISYLREANEILARARDHDTIPASLDHFGGHRERVVAAIPSKIVRVLLTPQRSETAPIASASLQTPIARSEGADLRKTITLYDRPRPVGPIRVKVATLGANCEVAEGNLTWQLARACDGRDSCDLVLDPTELGMEASTCEPDLSVFWRCAGRLDAHELFVDPGGVAGSTLHLTCGLAPVELVAADVAAEPQMPETGEPAPDDKSPMNEAATAIRVVSGTYGRNCGAPVGNATPALSQACNGEEACDYVVDVAVLGDPVIGCGKTFEAVWQCGEIGEEHRLTVPPEAGYGGLAALTCVAPVEAAAPQLVEQVPQSTVLEPRVEEPAPASVEQLPEDPVAELRAPPGCPIPVAMVWPTWSAEEDSVDAEPNNAATARTVSTDAPIEGSIDPKGDTDWYRFVAASRGELRVTSLSVPPELDLFLRLRNEDGGTVNGWQGASKPGGELDLRLDLPRPGYYYIELSDRNSDAASEANYELAVAFTAAADAHEPNDSMADAAPLFMDKPVEATILPAGDQDFYCLRAEAQGELAIEITEVPDAIEPVYRIRHANGRVLRDWSRKRVGETVLLDRVDLPAAGVYMIEMADAGSDGRSSDPFGLAVTLAPTADIGEPNGALHQATALSLGKPVSANILPLGDYDWYRIEAPNAGALEVSITNVAAELDPTFRVRRADSGVLQGWTAAERGRGEDNIAVVDLPLPGIYFLELADAGSDARSIQPYELKAELTEIPDPGEPNGAQHEATGFALGEVLRASILPQGDEDWYRLHADAPGALSIAITAIPENLDPSFRVRKGDGGVLQGWTKAERGPGADNIAIVDLPSAGTYYLEIADSGSDARSAESYSLSVELTPVADTGEPNDRQGWATAIGLDEPVQASILPRDDHDWYRMTVSEAGELRIVIDEMPPALNVAFRLRNAAGSVVKDWAAAPSVGETNDVTVTLDGPGTYFLELIDADQDNSSADAYRLTATLVPANDGG